MGTARETTRTERMVLDDANRLMTIAETAARLGTSRGRVGKLLACGRLRFIKKGSVKLISKYALNAFIRQLEESGEDMECI